MVQSQAATVAEYLKALPADRREAIAAIRQVVLDNVDADIEEIMSYGMIGYHVSLRAYPDGYHCNPKMPLPYISLASQKSHLAIYMMGCYMVPGETSWFADAWRAAGKKLDMGKSCVRFKKLEDVPLQVLAEAIRRMPSKRYIEVYEAALVGRDKDRRPAGTGKSIAQKKSAAKKSAAKKATTKKLVKKAAKK